MKECNECIEQRMNTASGSFCTKLFAYIIVTVLETKNNFAGIYILFFIIWYLRQLVCPTLRMAYRLCEHVLMHIHFKQGYLFSQGRLNDMVAILETIFSISSSMLKWNCFIFVHFRWSFSKVIWISQSWWRKWLVAKNLQAYNVTRRWWIN